MAKKTNETVKLDLVLVHETEKAYCFDIGKPPDIWVPKSQCQKDNDTGEFEMPEWLAIDKGLV